MKIKRFKQFIQTPKEEMISNSHGSHHYVKYHSQDTKHYKQKEPAFGALGVFSRPIKENVNSFENFLHKNDNENLGHSPAEQIDKLHHLNPLAKHQIEHIHKFSLGSGDVTKHLLQSHQAGKEPDSHVHDIDIKGLDKSFNPAHGKFHTYSGVGFNLLHAKPSGESSSGNLTYKLPTHLSSSVDKHTAANFAATSNKSNAPHHQILHFEHEKGNPLAVVGKHSRFKSEHEVMIPRTDATHEKLHIEHLGTSRYNDPRTGESYMVHHVRRIPEHEINLD